MHNADWYLTLAKLAGGCPDDLPARGVTGIAGVDGQDMWPYITGKAQSSPWSNRPLISADSGTIILGDLKLIFGEQRFPSRRHLFTRTRQVFGCTLRLCVWERVITVFRQITRVT